MNEHVSSLYVRAHELLNLGMDGSPIYSDHFARLNREVYEQALDLYNTLEGNTPEEEAELCLSILVALNATFYDNGRKQQYIQRLLDRCLNVLDKLPDSLLKVRLLTCCYGEVYEEKLAAEAHSIINGVVQNLGYGFFDAGTEGNHRRVKEYGRESIPFRDYRLILPDYFFLSPCQ